MNRIRLSVQRSLNSDLALVTDVKMSPDITVSLNSEADRPLTTSIWVFGSKSVHQGSYSGILWQGHRRTGLIELWVVVIDIPQVKNHPGVRDMKTVCAVWSLEIIGSTLLSCLYSPYLHLLKKYIQNKEAAIKTYTILFTFCNTNILTDRIVYLLLRQKVKLSLWAQV